MTDSERLEKLEAQLADVQRQLSEAHRAIASLRRVQPEHVSMYEKHNIAKHQGSEFYNPLSADYYTTGAGHFID